MPPDDTPLQRLRAASLRPTLARLGILELLEDGPPGLRDADTLLRDLLARGMPLSQGTVYRALKDLAARGLLHHEWRNGRSGGKAVYGLRPPGGSARGVRFVCAQCGCTVLGIDDAALDAQMRRLALHHGLEMAAQPVTVPTVCTQCAPASRPLRRRPPVHGATQA